MGSVTSAEYETMYHEEDESYFNDNSMGITTGVISAPTLLNNSYPKNSYSKHEQSFLPPVSCGNNLHVITELDEIILEFDTVKDTTGFRGIVCLFNAASCHDNSLSPVDESYQCDNISDFDDEFLGMI